jgi:hypothetical protein
MSDRKEDKEIRMPAYKAPGGIIYNLTMKVEATVADAWLDWVLLEHVPAVMKTNCFTAYKLVRLLDVDDTEGPTYAIQYYAESKADYNRYIELYNSKMSRLSFDKWGDRLMTFGSVMEVVQ